MRWTVDDILLNDHAYNKNNKNYNNTMMRQSSMQLQSTQTQYIFKTSLVVTYDRTDAVVW